MANASGDTTKVIPPRRRGPRYVDLLLAAVAGSLATVLVVAILVFGNQRVQILPTATASASASASASPSASPSLRLVTATPTEPPTTAPTAPPAATPPPVTAPPTNTPPRTTAPPTPPPTKTP